MLKGSPRLRQEIPRADPGGGSGPRIWELPPFLYPTHGLFWMGHESVPGAMAIAPFGLVALRLNEGSPQIGVGGPPVLR